MKSEQVLRHPPQLQSVEIDDDILLYDGEQLRLLAEQAAVIWRAVDGTTSAAGIVARTAPADVPGAADAVAAFLQELLAVGLLEATATPPRCHVVPRYVGYVYDGGDILLIDLQSGRRAALGPSGGRTWLLVAAGMEDDAVVRALAEEFPDAPPSMPSEVKALLEELTAAGLLATQG